MDIEIKKAILKNLKKESGNHSPSTKDIISSLGYSPIEYDFCFLSNPYATDIVVDRFKEVFSKPQEVFELLEAYPAHSRYVAKNISSFEGLSPSNMVVANGAVQAIEWVCEGWGIKKMLIPTPTFSTYYELLKDRFSFVDDFWLKGELTAESLLKLSYEKQADTILLIHPNNPSGEAISNLELTKLIDKLDDKKLVVDESFSHFLSNYAEYKNIRNNVQNKNVVFIKSMSKDFGVAGLRLGYLYSSDGELTSYCESKATWNLNNFSVAFSDFMASESFQRSYFDARTKYLKAKDNFFEQLSSLSGVEVFPSEANFFLIKIEGRKYKDIVYDLLLEYGIYVRTMDDKIGLDDSYIRVASRRQEENDFFIKCISKYLGCVHGSDQMV